MTVNTLISSVSFNETLMNALYAMGLPKHTQSLNIKIEAGKLAEITCTFYPVNLDDKIQEASVLELKKYRVVEIQKETKVQDESVLRKTGRTTAQIQNCPFNTLYIWHDNKLSYPTKVAITEAREDVKIMSLEYFFKNECYKKVENVRVVFDHFCKLTPKQQEIWMKYKPL